LILLKSSNANGLAYVETKNLDGETNLKHKASVKEIQNMIQDPSQLAELVANVVCEPPNDYLYKFEGSINFNLTDETYGLDHNSLLVRGSSLKNTEWVYGLVVYTGHETKIMQNSSKSRTKFSRLEVATNKQIILVFLFQIIICLVQSAESEIWSNTYGLDAKKYLEISEERGNAIIAGFFVKFGTWLLLFA
jgi:phospholipid-transporting ATPase